MANKDKKKDEVKKPKGGDKKEKNLPPWLKDKKKK